MMDGKCELGQTLNEHKLNSISLLLPVNMKKKKHNFEFLGI